MTSPGPAVPPDVRFTVRSVALAAEAWTTKVAGVPWGTTVSTDWMVRTGVGSPDAMSARTARAPAWRSSAVVCAGGGPMMRPALSWLPTL